MCTSWKLAFLLLMTTIALSCDASSSSDDDEGGGGNEQQQDVSADDKTEIELDNGTKITFPEGALPGAGKVNVKVVGTLDTSAAISQVDVLDGASLASQGPTIQITTEGIDQSLNEPFTLGIPIAEDSNLTAGSKAVLVKTTYGIYDVIPESLLTIAGGIATFDSLVFGEFSFIELDVTLDAPDANLIGYWDSECFENDDGYGKNLYYFSNSMAIKRRTFYPDNDCSDDPDFKIITYSQNWAIDTDVEPDEPNNDTSLPQIQGGMKLNPVAFALELYTESFIDKLDGVCDKSDWAVGDVESGDIEDCEGLSPKDNFYYGVDGNKAALALFTHDEEDRYDSNGYGQPENGEYTKR